MLRTGNQGSRSRNLGVALSAVSTAPTGDVERNRNDVTFLDKLHIAAYFDDLAGIFVAENHS